MKKIITMALLMASFNLMAEDIGKLKVINIKSNDTLSMRSTASHKSRLVTRIPYNARGLTMPVENCRYNKDAPNSPHTWCEVHYKSHTGWVNTYYIDYDMD